MKKILVIFWLLSSQLILGQTINFSFEGFGNEYELDLRKEKNNQFFFTVIDLKNQKSTPLVLKSNITLSKFIDEVSSAAKAVTPKFYLKTSNPEVFVEIDTASLKEKEYNDLDLPDEEWVTLLKPLTAYTAEEEKFEESILALEDNDSALVYETPVEIQVYKKNGKFSFDKEGTEPFDLATEDELLQKIISKYKSDFIGLITSEEDFTAAKALEFKAGEEAKIEEYFATIKKKGDWVLLDNILLTEDENSELLEVEISSDEKSEFFALKFCNENFTCRTSQKMNFEITKTKFTTLILSMKLGELADIDGGIDSLDLISLYLKTREYNEKLEISAATKPFTDSILSLVNQIENAEDEYSGTLRLNQNIPIYSKNGDKNDSAHFEVEKATVRFFNNRAKDIVVVGKIKGVNSINPKKEFVIVNNEYSLPLRSFNSSSQTVPISTASSDAECLRLNYNDLFQYTPYEKSFNYSARNKEYELEPSDTIKIEQRKLMDYFTAIIFSDFLGLNNRNSNALLQAEARISIPLYINNWYHSVILPSINADLNLTLLNGFDDSSRFISDVEALDITDPMPTAFEIDPFDIIRHNNVNAGININLIRLEQKNIYSEFYLGVGGRYYRAGLNYSKEREGEDLNLNYQINALSPEIALNWEIRPQLNFGADLNLAYNNLSFNGSVDDVEIDFRKFGNERQKEVMRLFLNLYSKVNPDDSNSGIYARLGGYYNIDTEDFHPQILVGYATNLSSFVNRFNGK